jgi:hypothetical protein
MYIKDRWFWEFYPPPYNFTASKSFPPRNAVGLGCADSGSCGCGCSKKNLNGLGDAGTFVSNLMSGNLSDALMGNDFFAGIPNVLVIVGGAWLFSALSRDVKKSTRTVRSYSARRKKRRQLKAQLDAS